MGAARASVSAAARAALALGLALALVALALAQGAHATLSGLYASNGLDQTEIQHLATPQEKRFVEREILSLLGLQRRPRAAPGRAAAAAALRRSHLQQQQHRPRGAGAPEASASASLSASAEGAPAAGPAPRFLLGVYEALLRQQQLQGEGATAMAEAEEAARALGFDLSGYDRAVLDKSDVIMGFVSRPGRAWGGAPRPRHARGRRLWFDAAESPPSDALLGAELRLYQRGGPRLRTRPRHHAHHHQQQEDEGEEQDQAVNALGDNDDDEEEEEEEEEEDAEEEYTVTLYQLLPVPNQGEALLRVDETNTSLAHAGWLLLNATAPLAAWAAAPAANLGLHLSVHRTRDGHEVHPSDIGLVAEGDGDDEERQPFMVGFFKSPPGASRAPPAPLPDLRRSRRRNPFLPEGEDEQVLDEWLEDEEGGETDEEGEDIEDMKRRSTRDTTSRKRRKSTGLPPPQQASQWASRSCQMLELYVNFKDLHWQDWIIAPAGFQAFYCSGECNFPLNAHMNATNHAIVQTLVHLMNPLQVPKPCCAPTKLGPIQILYYLEDSNVTLKRYKNMVVKSCGCH
ncbi:hypothetical protein R5R35_000748 [Gryllus longicercus]|uniref:TGF-beta family profile domain-containing protein n=1 Tax=Gryllus longicercus TaxID=2509291 RepID=A0AAN9VZ59_9ORTH